MSKPQYDRVKAAVIGAAAKWTPILRLQNWKIEHVFLDSYFGDDGEEDFKITAVTESRWNYEQAKIKWFLPSAVRHSDATLEETLVHELVHVLLSPEQEHVKSSKHEELELATERVTQAILSAYQCGAFDSP